MVYSRRSKVGAFHPRAWLATGAEAWVRCCVCAVISIYFLLSSCKNDLETVHEAFEDVLPGQERAENLIVEYSDSAQVKLILKAPVHLRYQERGRFVDEFPEGIDLEFMEGGQTIAWLEAGYARAVMQDQKTYLSDRVVLVNRDGHRLITSEMIWDERKERIYGNRFTRLFLDDQELQGYGFETDEKFEKFEMYSTKGELELQVDE